MIWDCIIVGGGVTGISAAIYAYRFNMKVMILAKDLGGLLATTHIVENYPGYASISGPDLMEKFKEHARYFNIPMVEEFVKKVNKAKCGFEVKTESKTYKTKTIILATGTEHKKLDVPGEKEYRNKGVSYCAICDAAFFKNKLVAVVGGSDSAAKEALLLSDHASKVYIIYRGEKIRPEPINAVNVEKNKKIEIINNTNIVEVKGDGKKLTHVILDKEYKGSKQLNLDGLFPAIGLIPQNELARQLGVKLNDKGQIIID